MDECIAFTTTYQGITNKLINEVTLDSGNNTLSVIGQWDTGATNSCISHDVISQLGLIPTGYVKIQTPSGSTVQPTYIISVILPNSLVVENVQVNASEIGVQGIGILIGMDIIRHGDFSISNFNGNTVFTFRYPSVATTDYVKWVDVNLLNKKEDISLDELCPCGSGRKYKSCCGQI